MTGAIVKGVIITGLIVTFLALTPTITLGLDIYQYKDFIYNLLDKIGFFVPLGYIFATFSIYLAAKWLFIRFGLLEKIYHMIKQ